MKIKIYENPAPVEITEGNVKPKKRGKKMAVKKRKSRRKTIRRARPRKRARSTVIVRTNPKRRKTRKKRAMSPMRKRAIKRGRRTRPVLYKYGKDKRGRRKYYRGRNSRMPATIVNPRRRRYRRRMRRNPQKIGQILSQKFLWQIGKLAIGIASGGVLMPAVVKLMPAQMQMQRRWFGAIHVLLGGLMSVFLKNRDLKEIGVVIAATGVYDLIASNITELNLPTLPDSGPLSRMLPESSADNLPVGAPTEPILGMFASYEGGQTGGLTTLNSSYQVAAAPVAPNALLGDHHSLRPADALDASYEAPWAQPEGLNGTNPYEGISW